MDQVGVEKTSHQAHRDALADFFRAHPHQIVTWELLEQLVGRNYQQRVSDARLELKMTIENVPQFDAAGKRLTGHYRYLPNALAREADTPVAQPDGDWGPLSRTTAEQGAYQR